MSELDKFRNKFWSGRHAYIATTGESPKVCICGTDEWCIFSFLASEECTVTDMRLTTNGEGEITYCGINIFKGGEQNQFVFGR